MKGLKLISLLLFVSLLLASGVAIAVAGQEKVTLCHKPGTPAEGTLEVAQAAVQAHLDHGDVLGACVEPVPDALTALNDRSLDGLYISATFENLEFNGGEVVTISCDASWSVGVCLPSGACSESRVMGGASWQRTFGTGLHALWWGASAPAHWEVSCEGVPPK
jgi:hypothetical protein